MELTSDLDTMVMTLGGAIREIEKRSQLVANPRKFPMPGKPHTAFWPEYSQN